MSGMLEGSPHHFACALGTPSTLQVDCDPFWQSQRQCMAKLAKLAWYVVHPLLMCSVLRLLTEVSVSGLEMLAVLGKPLQPQNTFLCHQAENRR